MKALDQAWGNNKSDSEKESDIELIETGKKKKNLLVTTRILMDVLRTEVNILNLPLSKAETYL